MLLNSMKVVSFCHVLQGPACTQYLADMGAQVIKIEPLQGERARRAMSVDMGGLAGLYITAFRNKRLFAVDLKSPEGLEIVLRLIDEADVVFENYRHGVMDRLGLGYEAIKARKPDIIYASGTGWGSRGPMLERESQDLIIQGRTGMMSATGHDRKHPKSVGSAIIDQHAGTLAAMGIIAAYVRKLTTGQGTRVESSLFAAGFDLQTEPLTFFMTTRPGTQVIDRDPHLSTWYHLAPYGIYQLKDAPMVISTSPMPKFAEALDSDELRAMQDLDRYEHRDEFARVFAEVLSERTYEDVAKAFAAHDIWFGPVHDFDDVADDPQVEALEVFRRTEVNGRPVVLVNHPIRYDGRVPDLRIKAYAVGEHTREILTEQGYTPAQIDELFARGVVTGPSSPSRPAVPQAAAAGSA
jgi:crotonobetainyl-CoA:carnitine CoA-transferase CaiB-like acyl-CoA transferase